MKIISKTIALKPLLNYLYPQEPLKQNTIPFSNKCLVEIHLSALIKLKQLSCPHKNKGYKNKKVVDAEMSETPDTVRASNQDTQANSRRLAEPFSSNLKLTPLARGQ